MYLNELNAKMNKKYQTETYDWCGMLIAKQVSGPSQYVAANEMKLICG